MDIVQKHFRRGICLNEWKEPRKDQTIGAHVHEFVNLAPWATFNTVRSKAVLLLWFLTVTCSCCPY